MTDIERAKEFLANRPEPSEMKFRGVPVEHFTRDELLKILSRILDIRNRTIEKDFAEHRDES